MIYKITHQVFCFFFLLFFWQQDEQQFDFFDCCLSSCTFVTDVRLSCVPVSIILETDCFFFTDFWKIDDFFGDSSPSCSTSNKVLLKFYYFFFFSFVKRLLCVIVIKIILLLFLFLFFIRERPATTFETRDYTISQVQSTTTDENHDSPE